MCVSVQHLTSRASFRPENHIAYSTGNEGPNICGDFSETTLLQRSSTSRIVWVSSVGHFLLCRKNALARALIIQQEGAGYQTSSVATCLLTGGKALALQRTKGLHFSAFHYSCFNFLLRDVYHKAACAENSQSLRCVIL